LNGDVDFFMFLTGYKKENPLIGGAESENEIYCGGSYLGCSPLENEMNHFDEKENKT
jgi:hypothetical protein